MASIIDIIVPSIGESVTEVTLAKWLVADGTIVSLDQALCEFESDKATFELPAEKAGKLIQKAKEGDDLKVGSIVAQIDISIQSPSSSETTKPAASTAAQTASKDDLPAAPSAAKLMREQNLSKEQIIGSGKEGRITKGDVLEKIQTNSNPISPAVNSNLSEPLAKTMESTSLSRNIRREKMSRMRRTISKRLVSVKNETAMLTTFNEVDMSAVMDWRNKYNEKFLAKYGTKLGFMSFFAKAAAQALIEMPEVNAHIDGEDFIYHDYVDISMAISTPTGLVVPPIHNVETLTLDVFELKLKSLAEKARSGKLSLEEMSGGTFTITNGGVFGSLMSTPIINEPQSAILGLHAIKDRPVAIDGQVLIRPMMYLALSYDHRVIDGSSSVKFLVRIKELIEDPARLFLQI
ncbi:MAG: 2-oxoglutarate dehydrogenase complex dihydrolipoyllysine-residue succinyltransferase [Saprospiraceae bacterium]|nr:2-oxoglutarate dehydrogenase complex dihydrolipoyllysine-residue succinyltransferase [Saprospiraceae bacterium]MBK9630546.1 2-oxoglutarate dehydrogenase complex dihydrolipoyllysine-residue succinyltransferase [Saprospiraceae bacterium]